jgi:hypothetical protein
MTLKEAIEREFGTVGQFVKTSGLNQGMTYAILKGKTVAGSGWRIRTGLMLGMNIGGFFDDRGFVKEV